MAAEDERLIEAQRVAEEAKRIAAEEQAKIISEQKAEKDRLELKI